MATNDPLQPMLPQPEGGSKPDTIFSQPAIMPVNNTTANAINAVTGLVSVGTDAYKTHQNNQVLKGISETFTKNLAAVQQGTLTTADAEVKNSAYMSAQLVARPDLASDMKNLAVTILGNSPTEELNKHLNHQRQEEQAMNDLNTRDNVSTAAKAGMGILKPDGTLDEAATAKVGITLNAQHYHLEQLKLQQSLIPSGEKLKEQQISALMKAVEPVATANLDSGVSASNQLFDSTAGKPKQDQLNTLAAAAQQHHLNLIQNINNLGDSLGASPEARKAVIDYYSSVNKPLMETATGDLSDSKQVSTNLAATTDHPALNIAQRMQFAVGFQKNFPGTANNLFTGALNAPGATTAAQTEINGASDAVNTGASLPLSASPTNIQNTVNAFNSMTGNRDYNSLHPTEQAPVLNLATQVGVKAEQSFGLMTPLQQTNYTHTVNVISQAASQATTDKATPDQIKQYSDYFNRPAFTDTYDKLFHRNINPTVVDSITKDRIAYATKTIQGLVKSDPAIKYDADTDKTNNATVNSLIGNLNTFSKYDPQLSKTGIHTGDNLKEVKVKLFGEAQVNPSSGE